jgi:hypothetical protein
LKSHLNFKFPVEIYTSRWRGGERGGAEEAEGGGRGECFRLIGFQGPKWKPDGKLALV